MAAQGGSGQGARGAAPVHIAATMWRVLPGRGARGFEARAACVSFPRDYG